MAFNGNPGEVVGADESEKPADILFGFPENAFLKIDAYDAVFGNNEITSVYVPADLSGPLICYRLIEVFEPEEKPLYRLTQQSFVPFGIYTLKEVRDGFSRNVLQNNLIVPLFQNPGDRHAGLIKSEQDFRFRSGLFRTGKLLDHNAIA